MASVEGGKEELVLPSGYRFYPTDSELVVYYLKNKILGQRLPADIITTVDVYSCNPYQLPLSDFKYGMENEWYFFSHRKNCNILTNDGYYIISTDKAIEDNDGDIVGFMRTLVFYHGKPPKGTKSNWVIQEYRVNPDLIEVSEDDHGTHEKVKNFVACKIMRVPSQMAQNGSQRTRSP